MSQDLTARQKRGKALLTKAFLVGMAAGALLISAVYFVVERFLLV